MAVNDMIVKKNFKPSLRTKIMMSLLLGFLQNVRKRKDDQSGVKMGSKQAINMALKSFGRQMNFETKIQFF